MVLLDVRITLLGGFEVGSPTAAGAGSRVAAAAGGRPGQAAGARARPVAAPGAGDRRAVARRSTSTTAAPRLHKAAHYARRSLGGARSVVLAGETVALVPRRPGGGRRAGVPAAGRGRAGRRATRRPPAAPRTPTRATCCRRTRTSRGRRRRGTGCGCCTCRVLRLAGRWEALAAADPGDEQAHLALIRRLAGRRRPAGGAAPVRAAGTRPAHASWASRRARRRCGCATRLLGRGRRGARPRRPGRGIAGRPGRRAARGRPAARLGAPADAGSVLFVAGAGRGRQDRACSPCVEAAAVAAADAGRQRRGRADRRRLAVRAGPGGAGRPVPAPPDAAGRARRHVPRRDRAGAVGPAVQLGRPGCAPAAVRRRGRAAPAGRRGRRRGAGDRRRARRRRRQPAAAALPGAQHDHRAAAASRSATGPSRRRARRRAAQPARTPRRRGHARPRPAAAGGRRRAGPPATRPPPTGRPRRDLRGRPAGCRSPSSNWPAPSRRTAGRGPDAVPAGLSARRCGR